MRFPVVQPKPIASVGAVRWRLGLVNFVTFVIKAGFRFGDGDEAELLGGDPSEGAVPLSLDAPLAHPAAAAGELRYGSDFAPRKPRVDVLLSGHAYGAGDRVDAEIAVGSWSRKLAAVATRRTGRIPLLAAHVREADGVTPARVGPAAVPVERPPHDRYPEDFDFDVFNVAPEAQVLEDISLSEPLRLSRLSPYAATRVVKLPAVSPRVLVECTRGYTAELDPLCDTLWIDTDRQECVVVWRRTVEVEARYIERILVSMEPVGEGRREPLALRRDAPRWGLSLAAEQDRLSPEAQDDDERDDLLIVKHELLCAEHGVEPTLTMAQYAAVAAELSEQRAPRAEVLDRHGLSEDTWLLEERGWMERTAAAAERGDGRPAEALSNELSAAQERLASPAEAAVTLEAYAATTAEMEERDPAAVLSERKLSIPAWTRISRRFTKAMEGDREMAARYKRLLADARGKAEPGAAPGEEATR